MKKWVFASIQFILVMMLVVFAPLANADANPYTFVREFFPIGFDNLAVCSNHKYLLGVDRGQSRVVILNIETASPIFTIGEETPKKGNDGFPLNKPFGVACDEKRGRILVSDTGNKRIQIFNLDDFSLVQSVNTTETYATIVIDQKHDHIFAVVLKDTLVPPGNSIRVLDATTLQPIGDPLSISWPNEDAHGRIMFANDLAVDESTNQLLVVDYGNARFDEFDLDKLRAWGARGVSTGFYEVGWRNINPNEPTSVAVDDSTGRFFIADDKQFHRIQIFKEKPTSPESLKKPHIFDRKNFATAPESLKETHIFAPEKLAAYEGRLFVVDSDPKTGMKHVNLYDSYPKKLPDPTPKPHEGETP